MDIYEFIKNFANQFDETELNEFTPEKHFRDLKEWSSLTLLAIMNMVYKKYGLKMTQSDMHDLNTIQDIYNFVSKHIQ